jgi:hypothetical protein
MTFDLKRVRPIQWCQCALLLTFAEALAQGGGGSAAIIKGALTNKGDDSNIANFIASINALLKPLLSVAIAVTPLVLIAGAVMMVTGRDRGPRLIFTALFALLIIASADEFSN